MSPTLTALARSLDRVADRIVAGDVHDVDASEIGALAAGEDTVELTAAAARLVAVVSRSHALVVLAPPRR